MKKRIYIYSPSGAVRDKAAFRRGIARLRALGHSVEIDKAALASQQRFAGDDTTRLASIERACASGADVALISRGGYGLTRILHDIPYKKVARAIDGGMRFVGISDFTAFQSAVLAKTGAVTWAGPALCEGFGVSVKREEPEQTLGATHPSAPDEIMEACFDDLICGRGEGAGWRQHRDRQLVGTEFSTQAAILWGGNLSVLTSLLGTPYFPQVRRGLLFLEDVAEHPYRIERMLTQLLHAGVLGQQKALILGQFTDFSLVPHDRGFGLPSVVRWLRQQLRIPVLTNLPYGHVATKILLPVGAKTRLLVHGHEAMLFWGPTGVAPVMP